MIMFSMTARFSIFATIAGDNDDVSVTTGDIQETATVADNNSKVSKDHERW